MLGFLTVVLMLLVAYAYLREGVFTAFVMFVNVFLAGLVAFNFWEPLADALGPLFKDSFLHRYEDAFCLLLLFSLTLGLLRWVTNSLAGAQLEFALPAQRAGGVLFGLATGYLVAGFLVCLMQTLPWQKNFLYFQARHEPSQAAHAVRQVLPPDRVWLALMHRAGLNTFSRGAGNTFDKNGTFPLRYERYRRHDEAGNYAENDGLVTP